MSESAKRRPLRAGRRTYNVSIEVAVEVTAGGVMIAITTMVVVLSGEGAVFRYSAILLWPI